MLSVGLDTHLAEGAMAICGAVLGWAATARVAMGVGHVAVLLACTAEPARVSMTT